ncbi:MAG: WD40 repeat domain-containing protein [Deltaproteobacteria bacterium]|nr:WD40 repeat domain-containing protein [Deltaproteobacteria bacterium]
MKNRSSFKNPLLLHLIIPVCGLLATACTNYLPLEGTHPGKKTEGALYIATAALNTPHFVPVDVSGPAATLRIGPDRGRGYGLGEGNLRYLTVTPDGRQVIVSFDTREHEQVLFALSLNGSQADNPIRIATANALTSDLVVSDDSLFVLYVDQQVLYRARLDGSDADSPTILASPPADQSVVRPRWVAAADRVVFEFERSSTSGNTYSNIYSARADGSDADNPLALTNSTSVQNRAGAVLPDGRVIASLGDGILWALPVTGGEAVRLSPTDLRVSLIGIVNDGQEAIITLRQAYGWPRQLVKVSTDGSLADQPIPLSGQLEDLQAVLSPDGSRLAYVAQGTAGRWAVFDIPTDGSFSQVDIQITDWLSSRIYLWAYTPDLQSLVACDYNDKILRIDRPGSETSRPQVLTTATRYQPGCGQVSLTADGSRLLYSQYSDSGYGTWSVPLDGGQPVEVVPSPYGGTHLASGALYLKLDHATSAIFMTTPEGAPERLTTWLPTAIEQAHLVQDPARLVYLTSGSNAAWYSLAIGDTADQRPVKIAPAGYHLNLVNLTDTHLILDEKSAVPGTRLLSYAFDGSNLDTPITLAELFVNTYYYIEQLAQVIVADNNLVQVVPVDGPQAGRATTVMQDVEHVQQLIYDPHSQRVLAAIWRYETTDAVLAAKIDGSEANRPIVLATTGSYTNAYHYLNVVPEQGRTLITLATDYTAVPHPIQVLTVREGGQNAGNEAPLAPEGYLLLGTPEFGEEAGRLPRFTSDGIWSLLRGPGGLYAARTDGSDAAAPQLSLAGDWIHLLKGLELTSDGHGWAAQSDNIIYAFDVDASGKPVALTPEIEGYTDWAGWVNDGQCLVYRNNFDFYSRLYLAHSDGSDAGQQIPLTPEDISVAEQVVVAPDGNTLIFKILSGPDRSLLQLNLPADSADPPVEPVPLSPIDDAAETLIGFLPQP